MGSWFVANRAELNKLYFFIAVSVIDPTAAPARKSNAQISFSQIDPSFLQPIRPASRYPTLSSDTHRCFLLTLSISLVANVSLAFFWHVLFYPLLSVPSRLRLKNWSRQKWARESRAEYKRRYYCIKCLEFFSNASSLWPTNSLINIREKRNSKFYKNFSQYALWRKSELFLTEIWFMIILHYFSLNLNSCISMNV